MGKEVTINRNVNARASYRNLANEKPTRCTGVHSAVMRVAVSIAASTKKERRKKEERDGGNERNGRTSRSREERISLQRCRRFGAQMLLYMAPCGPVMKSLLRGETRALYPTGTQANDESSVPRSCATSWTGEEKEEEEEVNSVYVYVRAPLEQASQAEKPPRRRERTRVSFVLIA